MELKFVEDSTNFSSVEEGPGTNQLAVALIGIKTVSGNALSAPCE